MTTMERQQQWDDNNGTTTMEHQQLDDNNGTTMKQ